MAGWNAFVSNRVGTVGLAAGQHRLAIESAGGDGCIEIEVITLVPTTGAGG